MLSLFTMNNPEMVKRVYSFTNFHRCTFYNSLSFSATIPELQQKDEEREAQKRKVAALEEKREKQEKEFEERKRLSQSSRSGRSIDGWIV